MTSVPLGRTVIQTRNPERSTLFRIEDPSLDVSTKTEMVKCADVHGLRESRRKREGRWRNNMKQFTCEAGCSACRKSTYAVESSKKYVRKQSETRELPHSNTKYEYYALKLEDIHLEKL